MKKIFLFIILSVFIFSQAAFAEDNTALIEEANALNNKVIELYKSGKYEEAISIAKKVLEIMEKALGKEHPNVATSLYNLASLHDLTGRYAEAEPLYKRSLEIREKALGKEHPDVGASLNNLACLYYSTERYTEAESLMKRSLEIMEKALGKDHPDVAISLNSLAGLYAVTDKHTESHWLFTRGISIEDIKRENVFLLLSEKEKIKYMKQNEGSLYAFINHTAMSMTNDRDALADTLNAWLRWKGAVIEAQGRYMDALYTSNNPEIKKRFDDLTSSRRELARLQMSGPGKMSSEEYKTKIEALGKQKDAIEAELSKLSKDFALEKTAGKADVKRISSILPKDSIYIDFADIDIWNFKEGKWEKPRYLAFVLIPGKEAIVKLIDLASTEDTDRHIKEYLEEMKKPIEQKTLPRKQLLAKEAKAVYDLIMKPLEQYTKGKKQLFISPDGNLNLIPFEVLMTSEGKYLMEDHIINYVGAGRDIVRFTDTNTAKGNALIMADPDYNLGTEDKEKVTDELRVAKAVRGEVSRDARGLRFNSLPDTKVEADAIEKILTGKNKLTTKNYQKRNAIEEVLFSSESPKVLHLATHGYFLKDEEVKQEHKPQFITESSEKMPMTNIENPMLRSGIVLAGVNTAIKEGRDDGMVTAEKILGLKLKGTDLVVLSACETGVGDVKNGEGVFGLKRAFILSGAKTLVMSLWSVPSAETTELMKDFYTLMSEGKTKSEALRQAKLNMMKKNPNPFYWGAFVMTGKPE